MGPKDGVVGWSIEGCGAEQNVHEIWFDDPQWMIPH